MRLYSNTFGPGPRRVGLFLSMKGIEIEKILMPAYGERSAEFLEKNPGGKIPVLELDSGECIFESQAIIQYLEGAFPEPSFSYNDEQTAQKVDTLSHLINEFFHYFYVTALHGSPVVAQFLDQDPKADKISRPMALARMEQIAEIAGDNFFLAGDRPSIPDFMLYAHVEYIRMRFGIFLPAHLVNLHKWYERFQELPGMYPNGWQDDEEFWEEQA